MKKDSDKVVSIFEAKAKKELKDLFNDAERAGIQIFDDIIRQNEARKRKEEKERLKKNKSTLRDYRITPK